MRFKLFFVFILLCRLQFVLIAQNVGIGTLTPMARLHVADSSVVFAGPAQLPLLAAEPPLSTYQGSAMLWYADKAAFRVGYFNQGSWSKENIGNYSFASGFQSEASGLIATAMGQSKASGELSVAGISGTASGKNAFAMGFFSNATGYRTAAIGHLIYAQDSFSTVLGTLNDTTVVNSLFEIGNGTLPETRRNALTITRNGNMGLNTIAPTEKLHIVGKLRLADGTQGLGKILSSDAAGVASWSALSETDPQVGDLTTNYLSKWNGSALVTSSIVDNNGLLTGIGIANPGKRLDVVGVGGLRVSSGYSGTGNNSDWIAGNFGGSSFGRLVVGMLNRVATLGGHNYSLNEWAPLAINPDGGNVGIGTFAPVNKLSIVGNADLSGNLGIGTNAPKARLDVQGTVKLGADGSIISNLIKVTESYTTFNVSANNTSSKIFFLPNLSPQSTIMVSPVAFLPPGVSIYGRVDEGGDNTYVVSIHFVNGTNNTVAIPASSLNIVVIY